MKSFAVLVSVVSITACSPAIAAPVRFTGSTNGDQFHAVLLHDNRTQSRDVFAPATRNTDVSIDPVGPTSFYHSLSYTLSQQATVTWTVSRLVPGTFDMVPITTTVTIDPVTASKTDLGPQTLLQSVGTSLFTEPGLVGSGADLFDPLTVTGSFSVTGPTETFSDSFSATFDPHSVSGYRYDVLDFPNTVQVKRHNLGTRWSNPPFVLFDGTVDGVPWDVELDRIIFDGGDADFSTLVPEPSSLVLLGMSTLSLLALAWRRRRRA